MEQVANELDGELVVNPTWWLKRVVTVHPLGGCPMGTHSELPPVGEQGAPGVVDDHGEVFGHPGSVRRRRIGDAGSGRAPIRR